MTTKEKLEREFEKLDRQEKNIFYSAEYLDHDYKKFYEELSFELNKKLNNIEAREKRYKTLLANITKRKEEVQSELKDIAINESAREKNKANKFGK